VYFYRMWLFPYEKYTLKTNLSPEAVLERLDGKLYKTDDLSDLRASRPMPYSGIIEDNTFLIRPNVLLKFYYFNRFVRMVLPRISGTAESDGKGSQIRIRMKLPDFTFYGLLIIYAFFIFILLTPNRGQNETYNLMNQVDPQFKIHNYVSPYKDIYQMIILSAIIYFLILIGFKILSTISKKYFQQLFAD
jgi:hypothetical protein